jgi:hypothetical protein
VEELGAARPARAHRCGTTTWLHHTRQGHRVLFRGVVRSGLSNRELPLHGVRAQRCGHLVLFRTKSRPRLRCGSPVPDMSRNKRGFLQDLPTRATTAFKGAAKKGVYVPCVLVFVMHACLCLSRLLQRGQHDDACLLVFVMHASSCLCRLLQRGTQPGALELVEEGLGGLHLSVPLPGRVSAPWFSAPVGGAIHSPMTPWSHLRQGWCLPRSW